MQPPVTSLSRIRRTQTIVATATIFVLCIVAVCIDQRLFQSHPHLRTSSHGPTPFSRPGGEGDDGVDGLTPSIHQRASTGRGKQWKESGPDASGIRHDEMIVREVDGLRNEQVVLIVTSSLAKSGALFRSRIIPASRTWMRHLAHVYVALEDTFEARLLFRHCRRTEGPRQTAFTCPHEVPTYVLTRRCTAEYYAAASACCKFDEGVDFLVHGQPAVYEGVAYVLHGDDDTFFRIDQVLRWLARIHASGLDHLPLVGNTHPTTDLVRRTASRGVYHMKGCEEVVSNGWYQPVMMNRAAVEAIRGAVAEHGLTQVCTSFDVSQDIGLGVFFWQHQLYHTHMPGVNMNVDHLGTAVFAPKMMAVHGVRKSLDREDCEGRDGTLWKGDRWDQEMAVGCGAVGRPNPGHDAVAHEADAYDATEWFAVHGEDTPFIAETQFVPLSDPLWVQSLGERGYGELKLYWAQRAPSEVPLLPLVARLKGYEDTAHYRAYGRVGKRVAGKGVGGQGTGSEEERGEKEGNEEGRKGGGKGTRDVQGRAEGALFRPFTVDDCEVRGTVG